MKRLFVIIIGLCWLWAGVAVAQQPTLPSSSGAGPFLDPGNLAQPRPSPGGGGSSFPLTSNVSAANNKIQNQAAGAANGDTVVYGQSGALLNGLSLNGNALTGLAAATLAGQGIAYGQSGAQLNGLNLNSNQLTGLAAATANNQGIAYGQTGALLNGLSLNGNALTSLAALGLTPAATFPASPTTGQLAEVNTASVCAAGSAIVLGGSTLCLGQWSGTQWLPAGGASGGSSSFPLSADVSANTHRITGFATNTTLGDALSQGQSHLNDMATATGNYAMGSNKLTGLAAGSANGDSLAYGQAAAGLNGLIGTGTTPTLAGFDTNGRINIRAHGALANGSDDSGAIQAAINASCAAATSIIAPDIYLPFGNYTIGKPLIITCGTDGGALTLEGDDHSSATVTAAFTGPAIIPAASNLISSLNSGTITSAALVTGGPAGSVSLFWTASTPFLLDLQEDFGNTSTRYLNGKSAATIRVFFKTSVTGTAMTLLSSSGAMDYWEGTCSVANVNIAGGTPICTGVGALWIDTDNKLHGYFTTSNNGAVYVSSSGTFTTATVQEADLEYDGAHVAVALNGTWGSSVAATGTLVQRPDEIFAIGQMVGYWPHIIGQANQWQGSIYDPEIVKTNRHTLGTNYTQDTTVFTNDVNTVYGSTFDQQVDMPGTSQPVVFGADYFNGSATTSTWASIHNLGLGCCGGHYNIRNLNLVNGSIGIDVADADTSLTRIKTTSQSYLGIDLSPNASFNSNFDDVRGVIGSSAMSQVAAEGGIQTSTRLYTLACGQGCDYINNGSVRDAYIAAQSNTLWGLVFSQGGSGSNINDDNENGGFCSGLLFEKSPTQLTAAFVIDDNSQISACAAPISPITVEGNSNNNAIAVSIVGTTINWTGTTPAGVVHTVGGTTPTGGIPSLTFSGVSFNGNSGNPGIPYADGLAILHVTTGGHAIENSETDWPLPQAVVNNESFFCPSCDPPTNPPTPATHSGLMTGAQVHGINGQWIAEQY